MEKRYKLSLSLSPRDGLYVILLESVHDNGRKTQEIVEYTNDHVTGQAKVDVYNSQLED